MSHSYPVKTLLQDLARKGPFFLHPCKILQDLAGSCRILRDLEGFCRNLAGFLHEIPARFLQDSCKIPQDPALQDLARSCRGARKKDLFLQDLARAFLLGNKVSNINKRVRNYIAIMKIAVYM